MSKTAKSNCVYCGLPSYGKGCRFAPKSIHVHATPSRCMYCGLESIGKGCRFAPTGIHVRFGDYTFTQNEHINHGLLTGYFLKRLSDSIETYDAYKLGLINKRGELIKDPYTEQEKNACSLIEMMLINLKSNFKTEIDITINERLLNQSINQSNEFDPTKYNHELNFKQDIENIAKQFYNCIESYKSKLTSEEIDQYIIESFVKHDK